MRDLDRSARWRSIGWSAARIIGIAVGLLGLYFWLPFDRASAAQTGVVVAIALLVVVAVNAYQLYAVATAEFPTLRSIEALAVSAMVLLVAFAATYLSMSGRDAAVFTEPLDHVDSLYFTLTTLTTIGFGDISPVSNSARIVVMVQMVVNVVVLGVFVKLVSTTVRSRMSQLGS